MARLIANTLPLPAGQRPRLALEVLLEVEDACGLEHALANLWFGDTSHAQGEAHVVRDGHMWV
jgi:hypothetical protein